MKIEHLAIWVHDLEKMKAFYEDNFQAKAGEKYHNPTKNFSSYFLSFGSGCRLELMQKPRIQPLADKSTQEYMSIAHFAIEVGSKEQVNKLTEDFRVKGIRVISEPRTTGDGYYESVILDPEDNRIELVAENIE